MRVRVVNPNERTLTYTRVRVGDEAEVIEINGQVYECKFDKPVVFSYNYGEENKGKWINTCWLTTDEVEEIRNGN